MGLEIRDIEHAFGDLVALDGVTFDVVPGVITGLLGPNGAGKTTLLRIMLGVMSPDSGSVRYDGRPVGEEDRRRWGYMPQERGLYPGMPAGDQVVHFGRLHGLSRSDATSRARALLEELGLEDRWKDRTDKLSGGMQQRLQLATSLVHDPEVIVLDEPSRTMTSGSCTREVASWRRCCIPPDSLSVRSFHRSSSPSSSSRARARFVASLRDSPCNRPKWTTWSPAGIPG